MVVRYSSSGDSNSTDVWTEQAPYDIFSDQAVQLCRKLLGPCEKIHTENIRGGNYNRVIGITVVEGQSSAVDQYVLRVARYDDEPLEDYLGPLKLLDLLEKVKIPEVVAFDVTIDNIVSGKWMLQRRVPGQVLRQRYRHLSFESKCRIAEDLGQYLNVMQGIRSVHAGRLTFSPQEEKLYIRLFEKPNTTMPYESGPSTTTTADMLRSALTHQKNEAILEDDGYSLCGSLFDGLISMVSHMEQAGLFEDTYNCLSHEDLYARNIMATSENQIETISGILDWDQAIFAPPFMSCRPPTWLWGCKDEEDRDEHNDPTTTESLEIKKTFDNAAGLVYCNWAYDGRYRLARTLMICAIEGLHSNEAAKHAKELIKKCSKVWGPFDMTALDFYNVLG